MTRWERLGLVTQAEVIVEQSSFPATLGPTFGRRRICRDTPWLTEGKSDIEAAWRGRSRCGSCGGGGCGRDCDQSAERQDGAEDGLAANHIGSCWYEPRMMNEPCSPYSMCSENSDSGETSTRVGVEIEKQCNKNNVAPQRKRLSTRVSSNILQAPPDPSLCAPKKRCTTWPWI